MTIGIQLRVEDFLDDTILSNNKGDTARQQSKHRFWYLVCSAKLLLLVRQDVKLESLLRGEFLMALYGIAAYTKDGCNDGFYKSLSALCSLLLTSLTCAILGQHVKLVAELAHLDTQLWSVLLPPDMHYKLTTVSRVYLFGASCSVILRIKEQNSRLDSNDFSQIHVLCLLVFYIHPIRVS